MSGCQERPTATELRHELEALPGAASARVCAMPDGSMAVDECELVAWCEAHWSTAVTWLYPQPHGGTTSDTFIKQFESTWGTADLVRKLRLAADQHRTDPNQGLDAVLTLIDPQHFGAVQPHLGADRAGLDFGTLKLFTASEQTLSVTNGSRHYICVDLKLPPWVAVVAQAGTSTIRLLPKQSTSITLAAHNNQGQLGAGFLSGELILKTETTTLLQVPLRATVTEAAPTTSAIAPQPAQPLHQRTRGSGVVVGSVMTFLVIALSLANAGTTTFVMVLLVGLIVAVILGINALSD